MIDKVVASVEQAVADVPDGAVLLVGGFGAAGVPIMLLEALLERGTRDLTIVANNSGTGDDSLGLMFKHRRVRRLLASFPVGSASQHFREAFDAGAVELELVPQGTLAERMRAAGAGLGPFFTPTGAGTRVAEGKEVREINGRPYLLEQPLPGDFALIRAHQGDRYGNLRFRLAARNFNPVMAMAGRVTVAEVEELVEPGVLHPDDVHTPGVFVDRVVEVGRDRS